MRRGLGYSVFLSTFEGSRERLRFLPSEGAKIFTSFHIAEEVDPSYAERAAEMCSHLRELGYGIIADVSKRTIGLFGGGDIVAIAERLGLEALRIDFGFDEEETIAIARRFPVCLNASTVGHEAAERIARSAVGLRAMHNYYPRPETGLDRDFFDAANRRFAELGMEVYSFVPGDATLRGPLHRGLPTLEDHRGAAPYAAFVDTIFSHRVDGVFVGDGLISDFDAALVRDFSENGVLDVPVDFDPRYAFLVGKVFSVRPDSPKALMRLAESREYATAGNAVEPYNTVERRAGSVTMDNRGYLRYSGEIQILREDRGADEKVNVIGIVPAEYRLVFGTVRNGGSLRFVAARRTR